MTGAVHRLRAQRRLRRTADQAGGTWSDFDRGTFLLGKQLMYFERYGKLFLADAPILADRDLRRAGSWPTRERGVDVGDDRAVRRPEPDLLRSRGGLVTGMLERLWPRSRRRRRGGSG